jgi:uncharacterized protein (TIGR03435 family)
MCIRLGAGLLLCTAVLYAEPPIQDATSGHQASASGSSVATIRPSVPGESLRIQIAGRRFTTTGTSLEDVMKYAYGVHAQEITQGPAWLATEKFDILADPGTEMRPTSDEMKAMVRELLADRFHLLLHRESKELPVYAVLVAKGGPKLTTSTHDPSSIPSVGFDPRGRLVAGNAGMADLATFLQRYVMDRPVVDETGLAGRYDLELRWTPDQSQFNGQSPVAADTPSAAPSLYTAIQEQLGLRLQATKAPVEVLVIDHLEQPSAN